MIAGAGHKMWWGRFGGAWGASVSSRADGRARALKTGRRPFVFSRPTRPQIGPPKRVWKQGWWGAWGAWGASRRGST